MIDLNKPIKRIKYANSNIELLYNTEKECNLKNYKNINTIKISSDIKRTFCELQNKVKKINRNELGIYIDYQWNNILIYHN